MCFSEQNLRVSFNKIKRSILFNPLHPFSIHFNAPNHSFDNFYIQGIDLCFNKNNLFHKLQKWCKNLNTYKFLNSSLIKPYNPRFILKFTPENLILFKKVKQLIFKRFGISILPCFSSYPNLKHIICKSKL